MKLVAKAHKSENFTHSTGGFCVSHFRLFASGAPLLQVCLCIPCLRSGTTHLTVTAAITMMPPASAHVPGASPRKIYTHTGFSIGSITGIRLASGRRHALLPSNRECTVSRAAACPVRPVQPAPGVRHFAEQERYTDHCCQQVPRITEPIGEPSSHPHKTVKAANEMPLPAARMFPACRPCPVVDEKHDHAGHNDYYRYPIKRSTFSFNSPALRNITYTGAVY